MKRLLASFALVSALALSAAALAQTTLYQTLINVATGTTGAVTATLAANAGKTTWICGFDVSAIGGTAAVGPVTVTGLLSGTLTYQMSSSAAGVTLSRTFTPCLPGSAINQAIAVVTTADGTASAVDVQAWGFWQ